MPIMEILIETDNFNQEGVARWNYLASGTPASVSFSFALASIFGCIVGGGGTDFPADSVMEAWQDMVSDELNYVQFRMKDVYDPVDFFDSPFNVGTTGAITIESTMSPTVTAGFRSNRTRLDISRTYKRLSGITEEQVGGGGVINAAGLLLYNEMASRMGEELEYDDAGNTLTFAPIVVSKEKYTVPSSGKTAYRYYGTETEQLDHIMESITWTPYAETRTQVSRQYGRGS